MKTQKIAEVAVLSCRSYKQSEVDAAVRKAIELIGFEFERGMTVLLKPNILGTYPKNQFATTTHPAMVTAVCKILKKHGCKIYIGDSSFAGTEVAMKASGIWAVAKRYGVPLVFEEQKLKTIKDSSAKVLKSFPIPGIVKKVDLVINMPKMKTHILADVTLGIKNLYGLIPGGLKQRLHKKARGDEFSQILVDIYQNVRPELNIMDAILGMEGHGPASGTPKKAGLVLASKNTVALDIAASTIMDFKPSKIHAIHFAINRGLYPNYKFKLVGLAKLPILHFRKPRSDTALRRVRNALKAEQPIVCDVKKCIKCGKCEEHCPMEAIDLKPFPIIDKRKCIRCFCCIEICPAHALCLGKLGQKMWINYKKD